MTVGIAIRCEDGIVVAADSLATFGRGVSVSKFVEKVRIIDHPGLLCPVVVAGAGMTAFVDKFVDRCIRKAIDDAVIAECRETGLDLKKVRLDIIDFADRVCEPLGATMYKEYQIDRNRFFGLPLFDFSLGLIIAGVTRERKYRAFFVHADGLTENIADYGTIGSGAAYAELFLRELSFQRDGIKADVAASFAVYAVKGAELMDPNVGGKASVYIMKLKEAKPDNKGVLPMPELEIRRFREAEEFDQAATDEIKSILAEMGERMGRLATKEDKKLVEDPKDDSPQPEVKFDEDGTKKRTKPDRVKGG